MSPPTPARGARAGVVGHLAALLAGCGSSGKGLIPTANAGTLQQDFANVQQFVGSGDCTHALGWIHQAQIHLAALPASVNAGLRAQLQAGLADLAVSAARECAQNATASTSTTTSTTSTTSTASTSTSVSSSTPTTTSSTIVTTSASSPIPSVTPGNNGGTGVSSTTTAPAGGSPAPVGGNGQGGNGQGGNGQGNGAGGVGAP